MCSGSVFWLPMNIWLATVRTEQLLKWFYCSPERIPLQQKHAYSLYVPECSELLKSLDQMVKNRGFPLLLLVEEALATSCRKQRNPGEEKFYRVKIPLRDVTRPENLGKDLRMESFIALLCISRCHAVHCPAGHHQRPLVTTLCGSNQPKTFLMTNARGLVKALDYNQYQPA